MRVWIINPFDELPGEPGRPGRFWSLCQVLADQGHDVTWWTADFSHRRKTRRTQPAVPCVDDERLSLRTGGVSDPTPSPPCSHARPGAFSEEASNRTPEDGHGNIGPLGFTIKLVPVTPYQANVGWARLRSHRTFGRNLETALRAETAAGRQPDRIVASWPPVEGGEVAVRLGREWSVPVTIDVMDAWPEAFADFIPGPAWVARLALAPWRRRARAVFSAAERVSGVGQAFLHYAQTLGAPGPFHLTYLGTWLDDGGGMRGCEPKANRQATYLGAGLDDGGRAASPLAAKSADANTNPARSGVHALPVPRTLRAYQLTNFTSSAASPLRLLYLGNIGRSQDLATVVTGLARLRAQGHKVQLDIAGSGEREAELIQLIAAENMGDAIRLHGFLSGEKLDALTTQAHIGVNPVRGESLIACPYKVADYLAAGLPVLNSLPGELAELLAKHEAGRSFKTGEPETFATAVRAWLADPSSVARMSAGARRLAEAWFAREKTYPTLARFVTGESGGLGAKEV